MSSRSKPRAARKTADRTNGHKPVRKAVFTRELIVQRMDLPAPDEGAWIDFVMNPRSDAVDIIIEDMRSFREQARAAAAAEAAGQPISSTYFPDHKLRWAVSKLVSNWNWGDPETGEVVPPTEEGLGALNWEEIARIVTAWGLCRALPKTTKSESEDTTDE
jgi:hypothetical protein